MTTIILSTILFCAYYVVATCDYQTRSQSIRGALIFACVIDAAFYLWWMS